MKKNLSNLLGLGITLCMLAQCQRPSQGEQLYLATCNACHMEDGNGLVDLIPAFQPEGFETNRKKLICTVVLGINDANTGYFMPRYNTLNDADLANVLNYIRSLKAESSPAFTDKEIESARQDCR